MADRRRQLWIGRVEVRSLSGKHEILGELKGAFVDIVTWASDAEQYRHKVDLVIREMGGLFVSDVFDPEPVEDRRARAGDEFGEGIADLISRAQSNPSAILYGTFHMFGKDDA